MKMKISKNQNFVFAAESGFLNWFSRFASFLLSQIVILSKEGPYPLCTLIQEEAFKNQYNFHHIFVFRVTTMFEGGSKDN